MKFIVLRTSTFPYEVQPCEDCKLEEVQYTVCRMTKVQPEYTVDLNSLDELMAFIDKYGNRVVIEFDDRCNMYIIEIYDDYRE